MRISQSAIALAFLLLPTGAIAETITLACGPKQDAYLTIDFDNRTARYRSAGLFDQSYRNIEITDTEVYFGHYTLDLNTGTFSNSTNDWGPISCRRGNSVR